MSDEFVVFVILTEWMTLDRNLRKIEHRPTDPNFEV